MRDMTKGAPLGHLFLYAVPLLLGNWLQLAYNAVDSIIAGRFIGQDALAAEGVAGPVMNLVILAISGLCIGAGVLNLPPLRIPASKVHIVPQGKPGTNIIERYVLDDALTLDDITYNGDGSVASLRVRKRDGSVITWQAS